MKKVLLLLLLVLVTGCSKDNNSVIIYSTMDEERNQELIEQLKDEFKVGNVEYSVSGGNFAVQIGAFRKENGANIFKDTHNYSGYSTIIKSGELNGEAIYRVFVTGFKSEDEAKDFIKDNKIDGFLIRD